MDSSTSLPDQRENDVEVSIGENNTTNVSIPMDVDGNFKSIHDICKLYDSDTLKKMMEQIQYYGNRKRPSAEMMAGVEVDPEYCLIVDANSLAVEIDSLSIYVKLVEIDSLSNM